MKVSDYNPLGGEVNYYSENAASHVNTGHVIGIDELKLPLTPTKSPSPVEKMQSGPITPLELEGEIINESGSMKKPNKNPQLEEILKRFCQGDSDLDDLDEKGRLARLEKVLISFEMDIKSKNNLISGYKKKLEENKKQIAGFDNIKKKQKELLKKKEDEVMLILDEIKKCKMEQIQLIEENNKYALERHALLKAAGMTNRPAQKPAEPANPSPAQPASAKGGDTKQEPRDRNQPRSSISSFFNSLGF